MSLDVLQGRLGYQFRRSELLTQALTHRSYGAANNERLEFLGDGVLNCIVGLMLYERFPGLKEGQLSRLRANLVNQQPLFEIARDLGMGAELRLGEGELRSGGASRPSILADSLESILGAVLLDAGFDSARALVERLFASRLNDIDPAAQGKDAKTLLQEWLQSRRRGLPAYNLIEVSGQAHAQSFSVECRIDSLGVRSSGTGNSRKAAEQAAAGAALRELQGL
jgi:ribonuclease-3